MKKIFSVLMVFLLIITPVNASAKTLWGENEDDISKLVKKDTIVETQINEYDEFKRLQNTDEKELLNSGWSQNEIKELKSFDYEKAIKERSNLSNKELEEMGYTAKNIELFKEAPNKSLSEAELRELAGKLTLQVGFMKTYNQNKDWEIYYGWFWDPRPVFMVKDIVGIRAIGSTNGTLAIPTIMSDSNTNTNYEYYNYQHSNNVSGTIKRVDLNLAESVFAMQSTGSNGDKTWARNGSGKVHFNNTTSMDRLTVAVQYGHAQVSVNPSVSVSSSSSVGMSFSWGINTEANLIKVFAPNGTEL